MGVYKTNNVTGQASSVWRTGKKCTTVEIGVGQYGAVMVMARVSTGTERAAHTGKIDAEWQWANAECTQTSGVRAEVAILGNTISKDVINEVTCDRRRYLVDIHHATGLIAGFYFHFDTAVCPQLATSKETKK